MKVLLALLFAAAGASCAAASEIGTLAAGDIPALLQPPAHGQRIIALWALDCVYCEPNLRALARLQTAHAQSVELVLVATDNTSFQAQIKARLLAAGLQDYAAYAYAETTPDHLDFLIDPNWGGEMPRTLVIRADGSRTALSGRLTPAQIGDITPP